MTVTKQIKFVKILRQISYVIIGLVFFIGFYIADFFLIPSLLPFPDDFCYYHANTPPLWVDLFYLDNSGHVEPPYSNLHIILFLVIGAFFTFMLTRKVIKLIFK